MKLKIMTFNLKNDFFFKYISDLKYNNKINGIIKIVKHLNPDILCTQEVNYKLINDLKDKLSNYYIVGDKRSNKRRNIEYNLIFVKKGFKIIEDNTFSLSKNIKELNSKYLLSIYPRVCTYIKIQINKKIFFIFNIHLDHLLNNTRKYQLNILSKIISDISNKNIIICGDFNMTRNNKAFKTLIRDNKVIEMIITKESTLSSIKWISQIDHILISDNFKIIKSEIYKDINKVSDHFPIISEIEI